MDWSREMVLAAFLGTRPTAGFRIQIREPRVEGGKLVVPFLEIMPGTRGVTAQVETSPYQVVAVRRRAGPVTWRGQKRAR